MLHCFAAAAAAAVLFVFWKWTHATCKLLFGHIRCAVSLAAMLCPKEYNAKSAGMLRMLTGSPAVPHHVTMQVAQSS